MLHACKLKITTNYAELFTKRTMNTITDLCVANVKRVEVIEKIFCTVEQNITITLPEMQFCILAMMKNIYVITLSHGRKCHEESF